jgi:hypothetical protein
MEDAMPDMDTGMGRSRTDQGLTGDKIRALDPAAAPVQTDAESAGTPTPLSSIRASIAQMMETARSTPSPDTFGAWRQRDDEHQRHVGRVSAVWLGCLVALGLLAGWYGLP